MVFPECTGWISSGYASTMGTLRGYALVNGFDWDAIFIWDIYWFTSWSFSWNTPLTGTLGGTDGGFEFMNIYARFLNYPLSLFLSLTIRLAGAVLCGA